MVWSATTPAGTSVAVRVRSGNSATTMSSWSSVFTKSPALIGKGSANPISPNPAVYLEVEVTLKTSSTSKTPILHDLGAVYDCYEAPS